MKSSFRDVYPLGMMACRCRSSAQDTPPVNGLTRRSEAQSIPAARHRVPPPDVRAGEAQVPWPSRGGWVDITAGHPRRPAGLPATVSTCAHNNRHCEHQQEAVPACCGQCGHIAWSASEHFGHMPSSPDRTLVA